MNTARPRESVRPYESLLILALRFMRLNRPTPGQFAEAAGISTYDVANLDLTFGRGIRRPIRLDKLRELLGATSDQWSYAILDGNLAGPAASCIRFCPDCLLNGYHTAFFQLRAVARCPLHGKSLLEICPNCGCRTPNTVAGSLIDEPLRCIQCSTLQPALSVLIKPPIMGETQEIAQVAEWFRWAATMSRVGVYRYEPPARVGNCDTLWASLETIGVKTAPPEVQIDRASVESASIHVTSCGICTTKRESIIQQGVWGYESERDERDLLLYKKYRGHLIKEMPDAVELVPLFVEGPREPLSEADRILARTSQKTKVRAFALSLFFYTVEGWGGLAPRTSKRKWRLISDRMMDLFHLKGNNYRAPRCTGDFRCSRAEKEWLRDHFLMEGLQGLFGEAMIRAQDMARAGYYVMVDLGCWSAGNFPIAIGHFGNSNSLEFWTISQDSDSREHDTYYQLAHVAADARLMYEETTLRGEQPFGPTGFPLLSPESGSGFILKDPSDI